jgi:Beta-lactamase class C and other penicillin binding proteins
MTPTDDPPRADPTRADPTRADPTRADALRRADAVADRFLAGRQIPGVVYGVVLGGDLVHSRGIGTRRVGEAAPPDADSVFRIASMTKSYTAAMVLLLRDDGRLGLDDPVGRHVPELADLRGPTADAPPVTIRHLLTMSAGFPTDDPWGDRQQGLDLDTFADLLRAGPALAWTPGLRFDYSNLGYGILGRVITNVAGREYREVVQERLLDPLGMTATTFDLGSVPPARLAGGYLWRDDAFQPEPLDPYGALASMGGLYTSVRDLACWVGGFSDAFPPRDDPEGSHPLSRAARREMQQIQRVIPPSIAAGAPDAPVDLESSGYGYGLFAYDDLRFGRIVGHSGGYPGFGSNMRWQPASGLGVVVLANHRYAPATALARELMRSLLEAGGVISTPRRLAPSPAMVAARTAVEALLAEWDDALATDAFAMNVDLDEPLTRRRAEMTRLRAIHGRLVADPDEPGTGDSGFDLSWWMRGERGRVRVQVLLSPESRPRIQALTLTSVPEPSPAATAAATCIVAAITAELGTGGGTGGGSTLDGPGLRLGEGVDRVGLERSIRAASARFAPCRLGPVIAVTETSATWRLLGDRGDLTLRLDQDPATGDVTAVELRTTALGLPRHAD